jgi:urate oxidase
VSGFRDLVIMKTTQSGFEGFLRDDNTTLPDVRDRVMCTSATVAWRYAVGRTQHGTALDHTSVRGQVLAMLLEGFFGPPEVGEYSPSVQETIYKMGQLVLSKCPDVETVFIETPNVHYLPFQLDRFNLKVSAYGPRPRAALIDMRVQFENDVFVPTSEPSGNISCTVSRSSSPESLTVHRASL